MMTLKYLNPLNWVNGIKSYADAKKLLSEYIDATENGTAESLLFKQYIKNKEYFRAYELFNRFDKLQTDSKRSELVYHFSVLKNYHYKKDTSVYVHDNLSSIIRKLWKTKTYSLEPSDE